MFDKTRHAHELFFQADFTGFNAGYIQHVVHNAGQTVHIVSYAGENLRLFIVDLARDLVKHQAYAFFYYRKRHPQFMRQRENKIIFQLIYFSESLVLFIKFLGK